VSKRSAFISEGRHFNRAPRTFGSAVAPNCPPGSAPETKPHNGSLVVKALRVNNPGSSKIFPLVLSRYDEEWQKFVQNDQELGAYNFSN